MEQHIRFCTASDGVRIAYAKTGKGPPLVKAANHLTHLEHDWNGPVWRHWWCELSENHQLVRYDARGSGLSDWDVESYSMEDWVRDLEAVVDALNLDNFPLLGISQGAAVCVAFAVKWHFTHLCQTFHASDHRIVMKNLANALGQGVRLGLFCVGSCWPLMLRMFALGHHQLGWMFVLGIIFAGERLTSWGQKLAWLVGSILLAWGAYWLLKGNGFEQMPA